MQTNKTAIFLGADHGGWELKNILAEYLKQTRSNLEVFDEGTNSAASVDYPDFGAKIAKKILATPKSLGILVCGTGIGISIAANRFKGIRAALVYDEFTAQMTKKHNNANIICFGGRTTTPEQAKKLLDIWLNEEFEGGRHQARINKLDE
jgi:ribose 5-phosphate isomerase B